MKYILFICQHFSCRKKKTVYKYSYISLNIEDRINKGALFTVFTVVYCFILPLGMTTTSEMTLFRKEFHQKDCTPLERTHI